MKISSEHQLRFQTLRPSPSNWKCYMFGCGLDGNGIVYAPAEGCVPNAFVRWMMKVCFACTWVYTKTKGEDV